MTVSIFDTKMEVMYSRILKKPNQSILLLGPRGTGKSTWIKQNYLNAIMYDLLDHRELLRLSKDPSVLYDELKEKVPGTWVVIDEIQKVPSLLNIVHRLIENCQLNFILSGSSARKLNRGGTNLLAGRAITTNLYPLTSKEVDYDITFPEFFTMGMMPLAYTGSDPVAYLRSYVDTYLKEEIQSEALTRNLGSFARFLEIAARQNGQVTNMSTISREAQIERKTVENYFQILVDTLIGFWLPAWKRKLSTRQVARSKFYFFDSGVARALSGRLPYPPSQEELGALLECSLINEIRAYCEYCKYYYEIFYWKNHNGSEVDIVLEGKNEFIAVEFKAAINWNKRYNSGLQKFDQLMTRHKVKRIGVFQGERELLIDGVHVFPVVDFLKKLWSNEIIR